MHWREVDVHRSLVVMLYVTSSMSPALRVLRILSTRGVSSRMRTQSAPGWGRGEEDGRVVGGHVGIATPAGLSTKNATAVQPSPSWSSSSPANPGLS